MPGPSNLYGVANPVSYGAVSGLGADAGINANTETQILATPNFIAPSAGWFYPFVICPISFAFGAAPPSYIGINFYINFGSPFGQPAVALGELVANATIQNTFVAMGPVSQVPWVSPGSSIRVTVNPQSQAMTVRQLGTGLYVLLLRGPDQ